jgi:hypothetical protein
VIIKKKKTDQIAIITTIEAVQNILPAIFSSKIHLWVKTIETKLSQLAELYNFCLNHFCVKVLSQASME